MAMEQHARIVPVAPNAKPRPETVPLAKLVNNPPPALAKHVLQVSSHWAMQHAKHAIVPV